MEVNKVVFLGAENCIFHGNFWNFKHNHNVYVDLDITDDLDVYVEEDNNNNVDAKEEEFNNMDVLCV